MGRLANCSQLCFHKHSRVTRIVLSLLSLQGLREKKTPLEHGLKRGMIDLEITVVMFHLCTLQILLCFGLCISHSFILMSATTNKQTNKHKPKTTCCILACACNRLFNFKKTKQKNLSAGFKLK